MDYRLTTIGLAAALAVSCGPVPAPKPQPAPLVRPLAVHSCVAKSTFWIERAGLPALAVTADANGYALFPVFPGDETDFNVHGKAADHAEYGFVVHGVRKGRTGVDLFVGACERETQGGYLQAVQMDAWPELFVPLPHLRVSGQFFARSDVADPAFTAVEHSDFHLLGRFLSGEDIEPVLAQRAGAGYNLLRVWTRYQLAQYGIGTSTLALHPDLYTRIPAFLRACARHGLYVEFTAYTGREDFDPAHWSKLQAAVRGESNALLELVNENDQGGNHIDAAAFAKPDGILASHGSNGSQAQPVQPFWDYATFHTNGASEEARKVGHNAWEIWSGPTLANETSRYPDAGGLWADGDPAARAFDAAAGAALLAAGSCFHSIEGKNSTLWSDATLRIAQAWAAGARSVPLSCQDGAYVHRQDLEGTTYLRVYQRGGDDRCIVKIRS